MSPRGWEPITGVSRIRTQIRNLVLLAGSVSATGFAGRLGRSVLDLPLSTSARLADAWVRRVSELVSHHPAATSGLLDVVVLVGEGDATPKAFELHPRARFTVARDSSAYRGTAGVLRDLSETLDDDDFLLVGSASQCPDEGVIDHLVTSARPSDAVTLCAGPDGGTNGLTLVRCGAIRDIPAIGYVDLKEQALPRIAARLDVGVTLHPRGSTPPIRSLQQYVDALRSWQQLGSLRGIRAVSPLAERWRPAFAIVEPGARVSSTARLHDAIVLEGGCVETGAEVVRSVVGAGGVVRRGRRVVDEFVSGGRAGAPALS